MIQFAGDEFRGRGAEYSLRLREANSLAKRIGKHAAAKFCNVDVDDITKDGRRVYVPTPQQIAERAAAIRQKWSPGEDERRMKLGAEDLGWQPPFCEVKLDAGENDAHS